MVEHRFELRVLAGNAKEAERAAELVKKYPNVEFLVGLPLKEVAHQLAAARLMIGLDSGLTHLSAALGRPTIGIYCASTPVRTPLTGAGMTASLGDRGVPPSRDAVLLKLNQALGESKEDSSEETSGEQVAKQPEFRRIVSAILLYFVSCRRSFLSC